MGLKKLCICGLEPEAASQTKYCGMKERFNEQRIAKGCGKEVIVT
jgi:hypothetical protein